jgi:hypothetical protein
VTKDRNALEAFEGARQAVPAWLAGVALTPDQQARACDLLRECMLKVDEVMPHDLALAIEELLTETKPIGSPVLQ